MLTSENNPAAFAGQALHEVGAGRLFYRESDGGFALVGVVELPAQAKTETLYPCRLNQSLWIDMQTQADPFKRIGSTHWGAQELGECDVGNLFNVLKFAQGALSDGLEMFVRPTHMVHEDPLKQWVIAMSATRCRLPAMPGDGLYELGRDGLRLIDDHPYKGTTAGQVLGRTLWGKDGQFGLATSMAPQAYENWVPQSRAKSAKADPMFAHYMARMQAQSPMLMVYTREQQEARAKLSRQIFLEDILADDAPGLSRVSLGKN